ncbi:AEC family transporter [Halocynthiibacter sp. C4]|uniref:AEC family transporter n=1 Tax=Halocynthiibacter sp. C4 TaxID=2992758 RepID=UPI00237BD2BB|nr:AEC family transporter [Halocynthiibacter sp. C4]MDE0589068.1 AEC family transporter [Halocynthiibacter sp. C4]
MQAALHVTLPVFLIIGAGYLVVWRNLFSDRDVDALMTFTQKFAIPCLLFSVISTLDLAATINFGLLASFYTGATVSFLAGIYGARLLFVRPWQDCVAIGFCGLFSNLVLLGLPITERAFGPDSLSANYAIIAFHSPFCYAVGITVMEFVRNKKSGVISTLGSVLKAIFSNALVIGIMLGLATNLLDIPVPRMVYEATDLIARAALPAALFGLGGVLFRYKPEGDMRVILYAISLSLVLHPAITFTLGNWFELPDASLRSATLAAAMAPGVNTYIFANMYGVAKRVAASTVLIATATSILTIGFWLSVLP